ncbi:hypothetical protein INT48_001541 [Thamnidium elegans]|uniref:Uncharacterized protein n=1 Tax=Thamnidium elegans TaxID=101142 RepID=A0A8H7SNJ9_9FUNG|nr:hypothetical protein INT48_001541 [Thamnidium elegans]
MCVQKFYIDEILDELLKYITANNANMLRTIMDEMKYKLSYAYITNRRDKHYFYFTEVDYSPEAIESRFAAFYLPSMTQDPWQHLSQQK